MIAQSEAFLFRERAHRTIEVVRASEIQDGKRKVLSAINLQQQKRGKD
jgi:hypothetical protein